MRPVAKHKFRLKRGIYGGACLGVVVGACVSFPAFADDRSKPIEDAPMSLGLAPGTPQVGTLPGGLTPWFRVVVIDAAGRKAWTNPIWVQDLPE